MKVKELPLSIYTAFRLRRMSLDRLLDTPQKKIPVIISLTTIESRIEIVDLVIRSLMNQSVQPKKIILWVHESLKKTIPSKLSELQSTLFEIRTTHLHSSHKKLIHTMRSYPDTTVVTCDDDLMYRPNWLNLLYNESQKHAGTIIANQTRTITKDPTGAYLPYSQWPVNQTEKYNDFRVLPIGAEGVLYPPDCLDPRFDVENLFMKLAPKADDLWFKSMSILKGTKCKLAANNSKNAIPIMGSQKSSLKHINIKKDFNSTQWKQLVSYFDLDIVPKSS